MKHKEATQEMLRKIFLAAGKDSGASSSDKLEEKNESENFHLSYFYKIAKNSCPDILSQSESTLEPSVGIKEIKRVLDIEKGRLKSVENTFRSIVQQESKESQLSLSRKRTHDETSEQSEDIWEKGICLKILNLSENVLEDPSPFSLIDKMYCQKTILCHQNKQSSNLNEAEKAIKILGCVHRALTEIVYNMINAKRQKKEVNDSKKGSHHDQVADKKIDESEEKKLLNDQAMDLYKKGKFEEALVILQKVIDFWINKDKLKSTLNSKKNLLSIYYNLGACYFSLNKCDKASPYLNHAVELSIIIAGLENKPADNKYAKRLEMCQLKLKEPSLTFLGFSVKPSSRFTYSRNSAFKVVEGKKLKK